MKLARRRGRKSHILLLSNSLTFARAPVEPFSTLRINRAFVTTLLNTPLLRKSLIMKGQQAFGEVTHALMFKHNPYRPGHPGAHLCPAKSMVETPTMAAP